MASSCTQSRRRLASPSVLPGFGPAIALTLLYLSLMVLIPVGALLARASQSTWAEFWAAVSNARAMAAYRLSFGASLVAATVNAVCGLLTAWVLVRYRFPGRRLLDAMVDLPFALPTAVAGIAFTSIYAGTGWIGRFLEPLGIQAAFTPLGIVLVLTFVGLPFVVRTLQPVLEDLDEQTEEAAASLGADRLQTLRRVILPPIVPAVLTGFALALARAIGEYGSVIFISGNMPMRTEIAPLLMVIELEQFDYAGATAIAVVMLTVSLALLLAVNLLQRWTRLRYPVEGR